MDFLKRIVSDKGHCSCVKIFLHGTSPRDYYGRARGPFSSPPPEVNRLIISVRRRSHMSADAVEASELDPAIQAQDELEPVAPTQDELEPVAQVQDA